LKGILKHICCIACTKVLHATFASGVLRGSHLKLIYGVSIDIRIFDNPFAIFFYLKYNGSSAAYEYGRILPMVEMVKKEGEIVTREKIPSRIPRQHFTERILECSALSTS
jgi:hypothetical protein